MRRRPLGSLLGHSLGLLGASLGPLGGLFGASLSLLGGLGNGDMLKYRRRLRRITAAPCLLAYAYVAELWAQSLVKLSDHVFPEPLRTPFGEHAWEKEENEENVEKGVEGRGG